MGQDIGEPNIYVAVLAAAFGGLRISVAKGEPDAKVLPVFVWFLTIPVFLAQVSALLYLRTDMDFSATVANGDDIAFLAIELLMIVIVYVTNFKVLLVSLQHLVFILNPLTWAEVEREDILNFGGPGFATLIDATCVVPWPFVSLSMNIFVNYMVCTDSVSLILSSETPKDAIFNSLAITFIVELDDLWWAVCEHVFEFKLPADFAFMLMEEQVWDEEQKRARFLSFGRMRWVALGSGWRRSPS